MFPATVYMLCGFTCLICAYLLFRSYRSNRNQLTLWTAIAFSFFTINNFFVVADFVLFPTIDFSMARTIPLVIGAGVLSFGLIWESV